MKTIFTILSLWFATVGLANTAPTPVITSATMRPGTTFMDVVFRVNDPDDATVKVRALAFINGVRSFSNVIKPVTFVDGTGVNLGSAITTNTDHTLTWDVAADWNIDLGQMKFEILALDNRGLLEVDWITIPAVGGNPALTISKDTPASDPVLDALFWEYAAANSKLSMSFSFLTGNAQSGIFAGVPLALHNIPYSTAKLYLYKQMNLDPASSEELNYAVNAVGSGLLAQTSWHAVNRPYAGVSLVFGWGDNRERQITIPDGLSGVTAIATDRSHSMALKSDGTVVVWGQIYNPLENEAVLADLSGVTAIAANGGRSMALKSDGTVVSWGYYPTGAKKPPADLSGVTAIAVGWSHDLALKSDGKVVGWGNNDWNLQLVFPAGLTGVTAISAGGYHSLALKSDGTVVAWGRANEAQTAVPAGLTGVTAIAAGGYHSLALKSDGTVVGWGSALGATVPAGLTGVVAIAAGDGHSLALKSDGSVVAWGKNNYGQTNVPAEMSGVSMIAAADDVSLALKNKAP